MVSPGRSLSSRSGIRVRLFHKYAPPTVPSQLPAFLPLSHSPVAVHHLPGPSLASPECYHPHCLRSERTILEPDYQCQLNEGNRAIKLYKASGGCSCRKIDQGALPINLKPGQRVALPVTVVDDRSHDPRSFVFALSTDLGVLNSSELRRASANTGLILKRSTWGR